MCQYKFINGLIERKTVGSPAEREDEHGCGGVETVSGREEFVPWLKDCTGEGGCISQVWCFSSFESGFSVKYSKHSPRTNSSIRIPTPIQRIKTSRQPPRIPPLGIRIISSTTCTTRHLFTYPILPILIKRIRNRHTRLMRLGPLLVLIPTIPRSLHHAQPSRESQCVLQYIFGYLIQTFHGIVAQIAIVRHIVWRGSVGSGGRRMD
mmetsp:Transcript_20048/g.43464  ORF Transcript_20048/g.43464 Transcript_20048/m.43464 type:complete len:207 (-) Transcript_20048:483-1103(-)